MSVATPLQNRIPELDGLRGVAILMVVSFHYINNQLLHTGNQIGRWLALGTSFGWVGVDLFFVLSGFLIGSILIGQVSSPRYFSTFFIRRLVRIVPNYFLFLVLFFVVFSLTEFQDNYFITGNMVIPSWSYFLLVNNFFMAALENLGNGVLSVTWSIAIEEQFYIIFPFIVLFSPKRLLPYFLMVLFCLAPLFRMCFSHWVPAYVLLPARMDGLVAGVIIAYWNSETQLAFWKQNKFLALIISFVVLMVCGVFYYRYGDLGVFKHSLFAIFFGASLIIALTWNRSLFAAVLRNGVLMWIGTISYSLYLFHYFILGMVNHLAGHKEGVGITGPADVLGTIIAFGLSLLMAWTVYKFLETPMVQVGKKFKY